MDVYAIEEMEGQVRYDRTPRTASHAFNRPAGYAYSDAGPFSVSDKCPKRVAEVYHLTGRLHLIENQCAF